MPNSRTVLEERVRESWKARACAAGLCVGAQIFLFGTGVAMPVSLNSAWIAAWPVIPFAALVTALCRRKKREKENKGKIQFVWLAATMLLNAVFAVGALANFAEQTLLEQAPVLWSTLVTVAAVFLCALSGGEGVSRLSFAVRWSLPALISVLILASVPMEVPIGLFPLLGPGAECLGISCLCMLGAASPALMLLLPPPDVISAGEEAMKCPAPPVRFFVGRIVLGAGLGALFLLAACVGTTYESIAESTVWGARLRIAASDQPHEGIPQTLLVVLQMTAIFLLSGNMVCTAQQALACAFERMKKNNSLLILILLMTALLLALIVFGFEAALILAPFLTVPTIAAAVFFKRPEDAL